MPTSAPYAEPAINSIYQLLFCDDIALYRHGENAPAGYPWDTLFDAGAAPAALQEIVDDPKIEARIKLLAYHRLRENGVEIDNRQLFGVIVEVGLPEGLDVIAAYADGTARYLNFSGKAIFWDAPDSSAQALVRELLRAGIRIVEQIGPWHGERRPHPQTGNLRISFLVSDGLYFGEGPVEALFADALAGPALKAALGLVQFLTEKATDDSL